MTAAKGAGAVKKARQASPRYVGAIALRSSLVGVSEGKRRGKYNNRKTEREGITFDSKAEADRYTQLRVLEQFGQIVGLQRQVKFPLMVGAVKLGDYIADFVYLKDGVRVIEDVKGVQTPTFRWKAKHMAAQGDPVTCWPERKRKKRIA